MDFSGKIVHFDSLKQQYQIHFNAYSDKYSIPNGTANISLTNLRTDVNIHNQANYNLDHEFVKDLKNRFLKIIWDYNKSLVLSIHHNAINNKFLNTYI